MADAIAIKSHKLIRTNGEIDWAHVWCGSTTTTIRHNRQQFAITAWLEFIEWHRAMASIGFNCYGWSWSSWHLYWQVCTWAWKIHTSIPIRRLLWWWSAILRIEVIFSHLLYDLALPRSIHKEPNWRMNSRSKWNGRKKYVCHAIAQVFSEFDVPVIDRTYEMGILFYRLDGWLIDC